MTELSRRRAALQHMLRQQKWGGFLIVQHVDCYYLCGSMQAGFLFIPAQGEAVFYVRRSVARAIQESDCAVLPLSSMRDLGRQLYRDFPKLFNSEAEPIIATTFDVLPVQLYEKLRTTVGASWTDGSKLMKELRMIKTEIEVERIRKAAHAVDRTLKQVLPQLQEGWSEVRLLAALEFELRQYGHLGLMRMRGFNQELVTGMLGSGAEMTEPGSFDGPTGGKGLHASFPQSASFSPIRRNEPILLDIGCTIEGYVIDQTRTAVLGKLKDHLARAYETARSILYDIEGMLKPGMCSEELYVEALKSAEKAGLKQYFMGYGADQVKFLGHGIGLEVDEWPVLAKGFKMDLRPGMVIAIEPKFTFPGEGVVGIENSYLITDDGFEKLTVTPEEIWEL
ncbi:M24 family metallopeptidase [Marinicrinis lubricantis]|uniref:M24 family metallopeptidase n=1 Tax=Marinicrinis lubricantis TaxID=2086470 RepID=A0ABW1IJF1_9BACL